MERTQSVDKDGWMLVDRFTKDCILTPEREIMVFESMVAAEEFQVHNGVPARYEPTQVRALIAH